MGSDDDRDEEVVLVRPSHLSIRPCLEYLRRRLHHRHHNEFPHRNLPLHRHLHCELVASERWISIQLTFFRHLVIEEAGYIAASLTKLFKNS
jgi:hypothetical protein